MIHRVTIAPDTYPDLVEAATAAGLTVGEFEAWAIQDAIYNHMRHQRGKAELVRLAHAIHEGNYADMD